MRPGRGPLATVARLRHDAVPVPASPDTPPERSQLRVDPRAQPAPSLVRLAFAPVSLVVCAALFYALRWPMAGVVAAALVALLASIWIGPLLDRARARLDRDLLQLLATGRPRELSRRVAASTFFRWLGAPGDVAEREGRAYRAVGDRSRALAAYQRALAAYSGGRAPLSVVAGLGHAAYEAGAVELAENALEAARSAAPDLPELAPRVAHLRLRRGERDIDLSPDASGETAELVRALRALHDGDPAPARAALKQIPQDEDAAWSLARRDLSAALDERGGPSRARKRKKRAN